MQELFYKRWHCVSDQQNNNHNSCVIIINIIIIIIIIIISSSSSSSSNGNRTEWSPIRSVILRVINKIGRPRSGSPICLITIMITDRIGRHEVLLPINHNFNKICDILGSFFLIKTQEIPRFFCYQWKKKPFKRARDGAYCPIT